MSPKEKCDQLYDKLLDTKPFKGREATLICVNEIIEQWEIADSILAGSSVNPNLEYWYEVRQEVLKL